MNRLLATLFYIGYTPVAPGTAGSIAAFVLYLLIPKQVVNHPYFWLLPLLLALPAIAICGKAEQTMERDDKRIVLDELVGYFFAVIFLPKSLTVAIIALILFRLFDIFKPSPVFELQSLKGGFGVVLDDVMAGIYSSLILQIGYFIYHAVA